MNAYITGICGFVGSWLAEELLAHGYTVRGSALPGESADNLNSIAGRINVDRFDITDPVACQNHVTAARPRIIFHLAAISSVGESYRMADQTFKVNVCGTENILAAVKERKWLNKFVFVGSSESYGRVRPKELPIRPDRKFDPISPYGLSKAAAEYLVRLFVDNYGLPAVTARGFNHTGPRQAAGFVIPSFCRQIAALEKKGEKGTMKVGNIAVKRDLTDVRDVVRGYRLLAEKGKVGKTYHFCCGIPYAIRDLLKKLLAFTDTSIQFMQSKSLYRKADIPALAGEYGATKRDLGWKPEIPIETTLQDTLEYWRERV